MDRVIVFDTTLRDGEQCPGASLNHEEKIQVARQLERLGVDIIEAGFPIASLDDFRAVNEIAKIIKTSTVCGLARALPKDIETCAKAIQPAEKKRLHTFISTSDIHLKYQIKKTQEEVLIMTKDAVVLARKLCPEVEFSAMDATRTDPKYLLKVFDVAVKCGATILNVPDTVGYAIPKEFGKLIGIVVKHFAKNKAISIAVHCHNDLGLATANALAAVENGATQIECTINGIGERAGNTSLEEAVMAIQTRKDFFQNMKTNINTQEIYRSSRLVSKLTGFVIQPNKAIVGSNAFAHESGIHQDGILKERSTYEIMHASDIGLESNKLVLGKHSGRAALDDRLKKLGFELSKEDLNKTFARFKELADQKKEIFDEDLEAIVDDEIRLIEATWSLNNLAVQCGMDQKPSADITLINLTGQKFSAQSSGTGPVDAAYCAINKIVKTPAKLLEFSMSAVTAGIDAQAEVVVKIESANRIYTGKGAHTDIVVGASKAYLNALNKIVGKRVSCKL